MLQDAENIGLDGFLLKPVSPSVLFDSVMQAFGKEVPDSTGEVKKEKGLVDGFKNIEGSRVLLAEDNEINQQVAREILEEVGLIVTVVNNGQKAVEAVKAGTYDAVLMDIQMPVKDGYTASREIRKMDSEFRNVPILAMTAHAMAGDTDLSLAAGMNDHVTKPIDPDQLLAALQKWISPNMHRGAEESEGASGPKTSIRYTDPADEELPETLPGFDLEEGLKRLLGNQALYIKLLVGFATNYATVADDIRLGLDNKDWGLAQHRAHDIKGLAGNLAAKKLQESAAEFEKLLKVAEPQNLPDTELVDQKFAVLASDINQALTAIRTLWPRSADPTEPVDADNAGGLPPDLAHDIASRIRSAVDIGDVTQLAVIAEELTSQSDTYAPYSERIVRLADDFDFDGLFELADKLVS